MKKQNFKEKQEEMNELLDDAIYNIRNYFKSKEDLEELTNFMSQFYQYSVRNQMLIQSQYDGATAVASYRYFQEHGFQVKKGEKAIYILAPTTARSIQLENGKYVSSSKWTDEMKEGIENGKYNVRVKTFFKPVPVFDVLQTNAKPEDLPKLFPNRPYNFDFSNVENEKALFDSLVHVANKNGIQVDIVANAELGAAKGSSAMFTHNIKLNDRLSPKEQIPTMIHELTHALLHNVKNTKTSHYKPYEMEFQAELCSYITCKTFGIDTSEKAFNYIATWTRNLNRLSDNELLEQLNIVQRTSQYISKEVMDLNEGQTLFKTQEQEEEQDLQKETKKEVDSEVEDTKQVHLGGNTSEEKIKEARKSEAISDLSYVIDGDHYILHTNLQNGVTKLIGNAQVSPFEIEGEDKYQLLKLIETAGYLPRKVEDYQEMDNKLRNHVFLTHNTYDFLKNSSIEDKQLFNQLNNEYDTHTGLLTKPFVSIQSSNHPDLPEGRVISLENLQQLFNEVSKNEIYDKVKINLHITPNEYYKATLYIGKGQDALMTQLKEELPKQMQELEVAPLLKETRLLAKQDDSQWKSIEATREFKNKEFKYIIQYNELSQDLKGTLIKKNGEKVDASMRECMSALNQTLQKGHLNKEQQETLQELITHHRQIELRNNVYKNHVQHLENKYELNIHPMTHSNNQLEHYPNKEVNTTNNEWQQQLDYARSANIIEVAQSAGITLKKEGRNQYRDANNHSMVFTPSKNSYYENNGQYGGDAIHFVQHVVGISDFKDAVKYINQQNYSQVDLETIQHKEPYRYDESKESSDFSRAKHYLVNERGLNDKLINKLHEAGLIRQDTRNNVLFMWQYEGKAVGCTEQGTVKMNELINGRDHWKGIQRNSETNQGFNFGVGEARNLKFFEAPIDALSYASLKGLETNTRYVAMDGLKENTVLNFIQKAMEKTNNRIESIELCVDKDESGDKFIQKFNAIKQMNDKGEEVTIKIKGNQPNIPENTQTQKWDWNNELKYQKQKKLEKKQNRKQGSDLELC